MNQLRVVTYLILSLILCLSANESYATHLLAGNMGYEDLGVDPNNPGQRIYKINFDTYLDCNSINWGAAFPENPILVGIFEGNLNANQLNNFSQINIFIEDSGRIEPQLPSSCTFGTNNCIYLVRYSGTISLPNNNDGYHIIYDRCCRPGGILNLSNSGAEALTFHAYIPTQNGTLLPNSTPAFTDTLATYICVGDTISVTNSAIDPDGDSLVYSFEIPDDGLTEDGNFGALPPAINDYSINPWNPYPYPIPDITWAAGYNINQMFGTGGYQDINSVTGSTFFSATMAGVYVATVEIKEYRNGVQIGVTRRNIQLLAVNCPNNPAPQQDNSQPNPVAVNPTVFVIEEGQNVCFDLDYVDPNGDSLTLESSGTIFDPSITNPAASIVSPKIGEGDVSTEFCWTTTCGQSSPQPYIFNVSVTDNGCPPKTFVESYQVLVTPFNGPTAISGIAQVCGGTDSISYSVPNISGATYNWNVSGGTISQNNGNNILVDWGNTGTGTISLTTTSQYGCVVGPIDLPVQIDSLEIDAGADQIICNGDSVVIGGSPAAPAGATISWSPANSLNDPTISNPVAKPSSTTTYTLYVDDGAGCNDTRQVTVDVLQPLPTGLDSSYFLCPGDTLNVSLQNTATGIWTPSATVLNPANQDYQFFPSTPTVYTLEYTDTQGCDGNDTISVDVNDIIPTDAGPDRDICDGDTISIGGNPTASNNVTFSWTPVDIVDPTVSNPMVFPTTPTQYIVITSNDTCSGRDTVDVSILPKPAVQTSNDTILCEGDSTLISVTTNAIVIQWNNGGSLSNDTIANPTAFPSSSTTYIVSVTDTNSCSSFDTVLVDVQANPTVNAGDSLNICKWIPSPLGNTPNVNGFSYLWSPSTHLNDNQLAIPTITTDTGGTYFLTVTDTIGCLAYDTVDVSVLRLYNGNDSVVCLGDTIYPNTFRINGVSPFTYIYIPSSGVVNPGSENSPIVAAFTGTYQIIVQDDSSCTDTVSFDVTVREKATAQFDLDTVAGCNGIVISTDNFSQDADGYSWYLNNVLSSSDENFSGILPYGTNGSLTLIATNNQGCNDTVDVLIPARGFEELFNVSVPNVFTPNSDGINDFFEFEVMQTLVDCIDVKVYNRWGMPIFESSGVSHSWDGRTFAGEPATEGVYYYVIDVRGTKYKGSVTLSR